jgi:DNA-binding response OmpR family regulator
MTREKKYHLLLVDDDEALLNLLEGILKNEGYTITIAPDGTAAINLIKQHSYDLILLDIKMQTVSGFNVLKFVKEKYPSTKVIMLTAFGDLKHAIISKTMGADRFIEKPPVRDELIIAIEETLGV